MSNSGAETGANSWPPTNPDPNDNDMKKAGKKSLHIDLGWAFSSERPSGEYILEFEGKPPLNNKFTNGQIRIDSLLDDLTGSGKLTIELKNAQNKAAGPTYQANVDLEMPKIQSPEGIARRLTNLGLYAGTDGEYNERMRWAIRAFKRIYMNDYTRLKNEIESSAITVNFLTALQTEYGAYHEDDIIDYIPFEAKHCPSTYCGMFGSRTYCRGNFENSKTPIDTDPAPNRVGVWEGESAAKVGNEPIAGNFKIYLRAFDPEKDTALTNRVNLPQPIHMAQFVLFELGYWLIAGDKADWTALEEDKTKEYWTRSTYKPDGWFGRFSQWAVREFQCHAKFAHAAKEEMKSTEKRYLPRLFSCSPVNVTGPARYPDDGRISGALNEATRKALQAWADGALRCPVIVYASSDKKNPVANGSDLSKVVKENLWLYNDHTEKIHRAFAIDYSGYYDIPEGYGGKVTSGEYTFPRPIVVGTYTDSLKTGIVSLPPNSTWGNANVEIRPDTLIGEGGNNGDGLTDKELSTFKVVRTAAHFECYGFFDCLNAYDRVTLSFGPCHWTLPDCDGPDPANTPREMPAFLAYMRQKYPNDHRKYFENFGLIPAKEWPITISKDAGTYNARINIQTEQGQSILCGAVTDGKAENKYAKNWHSYYRFLMATRVSKDLHKAMWDFTRLRIRDILNKTFTIDDQPRRVGDYVTSEKGVAMLLRWHIYTPGHLFYGGSKKKSTLHKLLEDVIEEYPNRNQACEDAIIKKISERGDPKEHMSEIYGWTNVPQQGVRSYYKLDLTRPTLSSAVNSFKFESLD